MKKNSIPVFFCLAALILSGAGAGTPGEASSADLSMAVDRPAFVLPIPDDLKPPGVVQVDFSSSSHWQEDSQGSVPGRSARFQASFNTCAPGFTCSGLSLYTRQGSDDRMKFYSKLLNYSYGSYTWRLYIPPLSSSERFSIGAFLRSDHDCRELDFEIGYGTSAEREEYNREFNRELGARDLLLYATNQGLTNRDWVLDYCGSPGCTKKDVKKKTITVVSQSLADSASQSICTKRKIRSGLWYDLTISFERMDDHRSKVNWYVSCELIQSTIVDFGMCTFQVYCSVENLNFIGDQATTANRYGYFAWIKYSPGNEVLSEM